MERERSRQRDTESSQQQAGLYNFESGFGSDAETCVGSVEP